KAKRIVLVAHSMSGGYALLAAGQIPGLAMIVAVDTLVNLDTFPAPEAAAAFITRYRQDYPAVLRDIPSRLFRSLTPPAVRDRLMHELAQATGDAAADVLAPLYTIPIRDAAKQIVVPVRGIGSDAPPEAERANRAFFRDYAYRALGDYGHYPMLEAPELFNAALAALL
ncbi:MAG TPA: alpha/beta hydrolase, partial [Kofleriaceae bacterium]